MLGPFEIDLKKLLLIGLILALPLVSLNLERRGGDATHWYDLPVLWVVNPTQDLFTKFAMGVSETTSYYLNLLGIKTENKRLKEELATLKQELKMREEIKIENERLKGLLNFKQESASLFVGAQVVAMGLWGEYSSLTINKGSRDGLKRKMAVITRDGVVGYLIDVSNQYSIVLALTDRNAVIDAVIQKNRARGIVEGMGRDLCHVKYLQRTDDVQVGDLVVTSGFDDIFPKGFPVGTVTKVNRKAFGVSQNVELRPIVDITRVEEVLVVIRPDVKKVVGE
jgi:rod shape-determining protein MreC